MIIARILGTVVSTQKDERLLGKKLLIVRPVNVDGSDTSGYVVAVDTVGAGFHERVLVVAGSSARLAQGMKDTPVAADIQVMREIHAADTALLKEQHRNLSDAVTTIVGLVGGLAQSQAATDVRIAKLADLQTATDARLAELAELVNIFIGVVERYIGGNGG